MTRARRSRAPGFLSFVQRLFYGPSSGHTTFVFIAPTKSTTPISRQTLCFYSAEPTSYYGTAKLPRAASPLPHDLLAGAPVVQALKQ